MQDSQRGQKNTDFPYVSNEFLQQYSGVGTQHPLFDNPLQEKENSLPYRGVQDEYFYSTNKDDFEPNNSCYIQTPIIKTDYLLTSSIIEQYSGGNINQKEKIVTNISRHGDLIKSIYMNVYLPLLPKNQSYVNYLGYRIIKCMDIEIGGQRINRIYGGEILKIYNLIHKKLPNESSSLFISNDSEILKKWSHQGNDWHPKTGDRCVHLTIPLPLLNDIYLPLISLYYHEVRITVEFADDSYLITNGNGFFDNVLSLVGYNSQVLNFLEDPQLGVEYLLLDNVARKYMKDTNHIYIINEMQTLWSPGMGEGVKKPAGIKDFKERLNYNHPLKYLIVTFKDELKNDLEFGVDDMEECFKSMKLILNEEEKISGTDQYYREIIPRNHFNLTEGLPKGVFLISFGLNPLDLNPSGSLNAGAIDNMQLQFEFPEFKPNGQVYQKMRINIYAINTQPLRIMSGMAGLVYSK